MSKADIHHSSKIVGTSPLKKKKWNEITSSVIAAEDDKKTDQMSLNKIMVKDGTISLREAGYRPVDVFLRYYLVCPGQFN